MQIIVNNHNFRYEMENIARMFLHNRKLEVCFNIDNPEGDFVLTEIADEYIFVSAKIEDKQKQLKQKIVDFEENRIEWQMATLLYNLLCDVFDKKQKWGLLTGVRPTRLVHRMLDQNKSIAQIREKFLSEYLVSDEKFSLVWQTAAAERKIIKDTTDRDFSLYISIPFCPTRCNYCSFVSASAPSFADKIPAYVELLAKEIEKTGEIVKLLGLNLKSVYFGGGTPTTLSCAQLEFLLNKISENFGLSNIVEYTVEAGRPDTVTPEKLQVLYNSGVDRISINPQTFNDKVLENIGRKHTSEQTLKAFEIAKKIGFKTVNMDLIAGLTGDSFESFCNTLDTAIALKPQNITLHTLTVKRAADLAQSGQGVFSTGESLCEKMVGVSRQRFFSGGYYPYYMYRQKSTLSNLENVGYTLDGHEGYYNVYIMDEVHSIIALGAGAVTKLVSKNQNKIQRVYNFKYPLEYINGFENIINRKKDIISFFEKYPFKA